MANRATAKTIKKEAVKTKPAEVLFNPNWWLAGICAIVGFALYANTIPNNYALDDVMVITQNEYVTQGLRGIPKLFSIDVWHFGNVNLGYYRPLSLVTFAIENQFFPLNPHVSHFGNVLLYALTGFFVCLLLMRVFRSYHPAFSFLVTLVFLAHPIHTEVVANIKSRDEILSFLNLVIAAYIFIVAIQSPRKWLFVLAFVFFYLALLSKETAITGLIILPVVLFFGTELTFKQIALRSWPFVVVFIAFQFQKFLAVGTISGDIVHDAVNYPYAVFDAKLPSAFMIFMWCIKLLVLPYPLSYNYAYNQLPPTDFASLETLTGILLALATLYFLFINLNKKTPTNFGLVVWCVAMAPAIGFVIIKGGILAERVLYAPALGFAIIFIALLAKATRINFKSTGLNAQAVFANWAFCIPLFLLLILYSAESFSRNKLWHDNHTLYAHDVEVASSSCQTHLHYGMQLLDEGAVEKDTLKRRKYFTECIEQFRASIRIKDLNPEAHFGIGWANLIFGGTPDSVAVNCLLAIQESSKFYKPYKVLGTFYELLDKQKLASYYYNKAAELNPFDPEAVSNHKKHFQNTGLDIKEFPVEEAAFLTGSDRLHKQYESYRDTGKALAEKGDLQNALLYLQKAAAMEPQGAEALINLSICYGLMNNYPKNIETLNTMLSIYPNSVIALQSLAVSYDKIGDKAKADECRNKLRAVGVQ